jgi:hypothetical protein
MARCAACGHENPDAAKFCMECATPLAGAQRQEDLRKLVTVVFCDLAGYTGRSEISRSRGRSCLPASAPLHPLTQHSVVAAKAILAESRGGLDDAAALYADAADRWSGFANPVEEGLALLGLGRCLHGLSRPRWTARK